MAENAQPVLRLLDGLLIVLLFTAVLLLALPTGSDAQSMPTRDAQEWPFPWDSIWNMPLGSGARYVDADIGPAGQFGVYADEDIIIMEPNARLVDVIEHDADWSGRDRCTSTTGRVHMRGVPVPVDFTTEVNNSGTPNAAAAILMPDGETIRQTQPLHVCGRGGQVVSQYPFPDDNIRTGDGIDGAHGGASMSSLGGTIRVGELVPGGSIRHALKVVIDTAQYGYYNPAADSTPGFRWPATTTDRSASGYGGSNPAVEMGSLLALRPSFDVAALRTEPGRMLAQAMQDYGGYLVDSSGWDTHYFATEFGPNGRVIDEFTDAWGFPFITEQTSTCANASDPSCAWSKDMADLFSSLHVVDNNSEQNVGGPGTRRVACAPAFNDGTGGAPASCSPQQVAGCGGGALAQEAEAGDLNGTMTVVANGGATGGRFVQARVGTFGRPGPGSDYAEYCVTVPSAGEYRIDASIWAPNNADDSFYVTIDDAPAALWDMRIGSGFGSDSVSNRGGADPMVWDLAAGDHVVRFHHREDGSGIDNFELVALGASQSECRGLTQEAESGFLTGTMQRVANGAASGGQFVQARVGTFGRPGPGSDYAEYCIRTTTGGTYRLDARTWAPNSGDDSFYVTIDDSPAALWDIRQSPGFASTTVSDRGANPATWNLAPGEHIVRFHHREDGAGIDRVQLVQIGQAPEPTATAVPPDGSAVPDSPLQISSRWYRDSGYLQRVTEDGSTVNLEQLTPEAAEWWSLQWNFEPVTSGVYRIRSRWGPEDGYLTRRGTFDDNAWQPSETVFLGALNESWTSQLWRVTRQAEGHYSIVSEWGSESGALTRGAVASGGSYLPGPDVRLLPYNASWWSQGWLLNPP